MGWIKIGGHLRTIGTGLDVVANLFAGELCRDVCGEHAAVRLAIGLHRHLLVRLVFAVSKPEKDRLGQGFAGRFGGDADGVGRFGFVEFSHRDDLRCREIYLRMVQQKLSAALGERPEAKLGASPVGACLNEPFFKRLV